MNEKKMSRWGVGPIFASLSIAYSVIVLFISRHFSPIFEIYFLAEQLRLLVGRVLLLAGFLFFVIAVRAVMKAYNDDALVTGGIYKYCRHPLYSAWVVMIVPGFVLMANSWLGLTAPIFMYFLVCRLVRKEEIYLENVFGEKYMEYKKITPSLLPFGRLMKFFHKLIDN